MKRKRAPMEPVRRSKRLRGEAPSIWLPNRFPTSSSPLINLPPELRNKIWELVLGHRTVHVAKFYGDMSIDDDDDSHDINGKYKLTHEICKDRWTDREWYELTSSDDPDHHYGNFESEVSKKYANRPNLECWRRHALCKASQVFPYEGLAEPGPDLIDCRLLCVSRQIYAEAHLVPYTSNTFSFLRPGRFEEFVKSLTLDQRRAVKAISLTMNWEDDRWTTRQEGLPHHDWESQLPWLRVWDFTGLRTVHIQVNANFDRATKYMQVAKSKGMIWTGLLLFRNLQEATAIVTEYHNCRPCGGFFDEPWDTHDQSPMWTLPERQSIAEDIRDTLLREKSTHEIGFGGAVVCLEISGGTLIWEMNRSLRLRKMLQEMYGITSISVAAFRSNS